MYRPVCTKATRNKMSHVTPSAQNLKVHIMIEGRPSDLIFGLIFLQLSQASATIRWLAVCEFMSWYIQYVISSCVWSGIRIHRRFWSSALPVKVREGWSEPLAWWEMMQVFWVWGEEEIISGKTQLLFTCTHSRWKINPDRFNGFHNKDSVLFSHSFQCVSHY